MTCENYYGGEIANCSETCVAGCVCRRGLIKDSEGNCIEPTQCPQAQGKYFIFIT